PPPTHSPFSSSRAHPPPPSFPTRRSSDLINEPYGALLVPFPGELQRSSAGLSRHREPKRDVAVEMLNPLCQSLDVADRHDEAVEDRKSTRLNSSHVAISYAVFCLKKKNTN